MKTIYKYPLDPLLVTEVETPAGSTVISTETVNGIPTVYAMVDTDVEEKEIHKILTFGTGHPIPRELKARFIGTIKQDIYVWHIFEQEKEK